MRSDSSNPLSPLLFAIYIDPHFEAIFIIYPLNVLADVINVYLLMIFISWHPILSNSQKDLSSYVAHQLDSKCF